MEKSNIGDLELEFHSIALCKSTLLVVKCRRGMLGCGYISLATADKTGEAVALVTGVKNLSDMMNASVCGVSRAAAELGIKTGDLGVDAVKKLS